MHSRQLRLALILDPKFLYLRGFEVGYSLNVTHHTRWWNLWWPQVFMTSWNLLISIGQLNYEEMITRISVSLSCLSWGMFLFAGFGFKCLAACNRHNGLYNLSKRSKCSSFMTSIRRLLQKNAAFMTLLSFLLLSTSEP